MSLPIPCRVKVLNGDGSALIGYGTYVGDVTVYFTVDLENPPNWILSNENAEVKPESPFFPQGTTIKSDDNPKIVLDDGKVVYGCQVWWEPVQEETQNAAG